MEASCPFPLEGKDTIDLPSQEQQDLKTQKAMKHLREYIERCGGTLPQSWDCALRFRTTTRRNGRLGLTTDNYYYSPCGKTFRTHRQVADFLGLPEPQSGQPQYIVTVPGQLQQQQGSSAPAARVPTDPRIRAGVKRSAPAATGAGSCDQLTKRPASSVTSSNTTAGCPASNCTQEHLCAPAAAPAAAATSFSAPSCCSEHQQHAGVVSQCAQSMPPPPTQPLRRTKGSLAAKYAGIGSGAGTMRGGVAINTAGSFYDLCFSLVAAGSGTGQLPLQQLQQHQSRAGLTPVGVVAKPQPTPAVVLQQQQQQQVMMTRIAAAPQPHVPAQKQQHQPASAAVLAPATAIKLQQQYAAVSPASSSTSSSDCTADSDLQTAPVDSKVANLAHKLGVQLEAEQLQFGVPAAVTAQAPNATSAASSGCGMTANKTGCSSLTSGCAFSNRSKSSCKPTSLAAATAVAKQRSSKVAAKFNENAKQPQQRCSRTDAVKQLQQQQGPKPWKPRAQPAWRLHLRQLASQIAVEKAAASNSAVTAAADSGASGATVQ